MNNPLVTPEIGLLFWTIIVFLILLLLLKKFAWKPIMSAVNKRSDDIDNALKNAEVAKEEIKKLKANNDDLLKEARLERDSMLKEAVSIKDKIIDDAKTAAKAEESRIIDAAKKAIEREKNAALSELKITAGKVAVDIAEKILSKELNNSSEQQKIIANYIEKLKFN